MTVERQTWQVNGTEGAHSIYMTSPQTGEGERKECKHKWTGLLNAAISSGEWCPKCEAVRASNALNEEINVGEPTTVD